MNGAKSLTEAVGLYLSIESVGERSVLGEALAASRCGRYRSENVGLSSENIGENPIPRNPKGSSGRFVRGGLVRA
jgi:hypothetical protein